MSNVLRPAAGLAAATILAAALLPLIVWRAPARAAEPIAFAIPAEEGYGIADCMQAGSACGAAMADSWCEAHGHHNAVAFGLAADATGGIGARDAGMAADAVLIRCGD